jgi:adenylate cyclase
MPQVVIEQPDVPPMTVVLKNPEMSFGRAPDNDIVLTGKEVSGHHAKFLTRGDHIVIVDLQSLNGTYVNRQRIVERVLTHMDEILFGAKCRLVFRDDTKVAKAGGSESTAGDSALAQDLNRIRDEMDRVASNLTMIGKRGNTPPVQEAGGSASAISSDELLKMSRAYRRLDAMYQITKLIASDFDLNSRLAKVLDKAIEATDAERGFVMMRDDVRNTLQVSVAREMGQELHASSPSMGVAGKAAVDGEPVLMENAGSDEEFGGRDSIIRLRITSAMAAPLKVEDRTLGSIYVDTRSPQVQFNEEDLELFASLAAQSALAIENVRLYEQMVETEKKRANLGRFLSPAIVDVIMNQAEELVLGGSDLLVTTMFCDVRGFTAISENVTAKTLIKVLNDHFTAMTSIVFEYGGTLDKYNGDEVMALFGAPFNAEDDAVRAVRAALAMKARNAEMNYARARDGEPTFDIGIGIATGEVIAGYIGSPERMDFTVIGDRVNTASRLCSIAQAGQIVIADTTYQLVNDAVELRSIGPQVLRNKAKPVQAFEVIALKHPQPATASQ